jgi:hypothetical protein
MTGTDNQADGAAAPDVDSLRPDPGAPEAGARRMPATLREAVRIEFGRALRPPFETPIVVAVNGTLMVVFWFFAPKEIKNALFSLHGALAFPMVLAGWMFSDVPATNLLGPDAHRAVRALGDPKMLRRLLYAKNIVLWCLIGPLCAAMALGIGVNSNDLTTTLFTILAIAVIPFGVLGVSAWVGIRFPYHPIPIRERWAARRQFTKMILRWGVLALTPYGLVPALAAVAMLPTLMLWGFFANHGLQGRLSDTEYAWGISVACVIAVVGSFGGHRVGAKMAHRRRATLSAYLGDPSNG